MYLLYCFIFADFFAAEAPRRVGFIATIIVPLGFMTPRNLLLGMCFLRAKKPRRAARIFLEAVFFCKLALLNNG